MKYIINKTNHCDFKVLEKNKLPARAYAIPYSSKGVLAGTAFEKERYSSDMVQLLSGEWDFKFFPKKSTMPDSIDTSRVRFSPVSVPSTWQRTGFQNPVYLNCPYEFKAQLPDVPEDMPCGVYRKKFTVNKLSKTMYITFLGVSSCIDLYINGKFVGYSEGSHISAEFDIGSFITEGENELLAVGFKWSNGTYLECQDMFRENGIFRDVYITGYGDAFINDYQASSEKNDSGWSLKVNAQLLGNLQNKSVTIELKNGEDSILTDTRAAVSDFEAVLSVPNVKEWNAEIPNTYVLYVTLSAGDEELMTVRSTVGFRTIEIAGNVFLFNGKPIKIKGVNHHDTHPVRGYAMTHDDLIRDVKLMKSLNVNAVRTSHYPPDPFFLTLCDIYGLYVIDEADIETHGCWELFGDVDVISMDLKWAPRYVDRVKRMYMRDRSHPSIIMWSLGNEAGGYRCQDKCRDYLKSTGTDIPVHYEGVVRTKRFHYDVISEMYTDTYELKNMLDGKRKRDGKVCSEYSKHPFFLCEYAHAMGVGPGGLEDYWKLFYTSDSFMGGCIWEWADHTVYHAPGADSYKYEYTYGGDHGEKKHDGNFCVDGLMYANRQPHTGALEMKTVYRPLRSEYVGGKVFCIENTNRFRSSGYIDIAWEFLINGEITAEGTIKADIKPMSAECFELDIPAIPEEQDCHINFIYTDKEAELAVEQLTLNDVPFEYDIEIGSRISAESDAGIVTVGFENGIAQFDALTGSLIAYEIGGASYLNETPADDKRGFVPNLFRALIDNDAAMRGQWTGKGLDKLKENLVNFNAEIDDGEIVITSDYTLDYGKKQLYSFSIKYTISSLGAMEITAKLRLLDDEAALDLPRFGLMIELPHAIENVKYYGRGTAENMPDFKEQSPVGIYSDTVTNMFEKYVFPQESGMHCDVKWLELTDKSGKGFRIFAEDKLAFSVHHFTQQAINEAKHQEDVTDMNTTVLTLDGYVRGIGTSSCGPDTRYEYRKDLSEEPDGIEFSFTVIPC